LAQKAKKDWVKELCNKNKVSFVRLQETKMESIDLLSVRLCWGNVNFDYVHSDSIGLEEVPLGGSAYTWCHKSASKMSKLDRFLSDHRYILLREASFDYGPTSFRFFYFWFDVDGFDKFVTDSWKDAPGDDSNTMHNLCGKFKFLKILGKLQQVNKAQASEVAQKAKIK
ncbi:hypothetical protein Tco_0057125, partial [Tanacetum coccineum]